VIDLQANFRSRRPLLDALNCIFSRVMTADAVDIEYDQTHFLLCKTEYPDAENGRSYRGAPIELHLIPDARSPEQHAPDDDARAGEESDAGAQEDDDGEDLTRTEREATLMALEILRIVGKDAAGSPPMLVMDMEEGKKEMSPRPATFRDIVILLRSMQHKADQMAAVLRAHGIDVYAASNAGYFQSMEVRDMLALLTLLDNQRQDIPLAALFRSPLGLAENPETSLACIRSAYSASIPFHEAASRYRAEKTDDLAKELDAFFARLERWRRAAQLRPLADVIWAIYHETGYLTYVAGLEKGEQRVKNLLDLHERSAEFGKFQSRGLSRFMRFIEQLQEETDLGQPSTANEAENVVRIMSVHRSKGLEFPIVFIPDLGKRINMKSAQGPILADRSAGLGMRVVDEAKRCRYPSLAWTLVERRLRQQALAEELRVLYVAMTRAKEHLILIGTAKPKALERWVSDWQDYRGPMPTDAILAATNMLDWIGPVEVMTRTEPTPIFRAIRYSAEDIAAWSTPGSSRRAMSPLQATMAAGKPLPFAPPASEAAQAVIDRISQAYPFARFSDMRATQTVTSATHLPVATPIAPAAAISITNAGVATSVATSTSVTRLPPRPKFLEQAELSATERGTATHLVLQYLDFQAKCDLADIAAQVNSLVSRHILTSSEAAAVDQKAIAWLMADSVGQLLRQGGNVVRRELPVNFPRLGDAEPSKDPLDRVMVRGRIDVLILGDRTATLLDYKTDKVSADNVPTRGDAYGPQLRAYRDAIEMITGLKIDAMYLAFLWPRVMYRLPNEPGS
jgi:ATP-dependent helicase/nuclease subunit A